MKSSKIEPLGAKRPVLNTLAQTMPASPSRPLRASQTGRREQMAAAIAGDDSDIPSSISKDPSATFWSWALPAG